MDHRMEDADQPAQWLHPEHSSVPGDIFGEPVTKTKIGSDFQAQVPPLMTENERLQLIMLPSSHNGNLSVQDQLMFGQSIPVVWIQDQSKSNKEIAIQSQVNTLQSTKGKYGVLGFGLLPVPGSSSESLTTAEHCSFLLALYIFGKNFHVVNKFMGNKGVRNVLSYYYGKFYKTGEHQKWLRYKKMKGGKKTTPGRIIFSDWRQEELFSRLFPNVTDECKTTLRQASKMFRDGELLFEAYVFTVRDIVGIDLLIEAIGIGKGKRDLSGKAKKPVIKKILHSPLKTEQIVNLLSQGKRLNKAKVSESEVFWEAVWPRLVARGWHSQQTINYTFQTSKKSLVFLAPGIKKFSRRGLHKGIQYFESFKDVLNKVTSEPQLLEPEPEPIQDRPVKSPSKQNHMRFTIVDSGFVRTEDGFVRKSKLTSMYDTENIDMQDQNNLATTPDSDGGEFWNPKDAGANTDQEAGVDGQRQGTRNRLLTAKALEALASGSLNPKKKKKKRDVEDKLSPRHVRAKLAIVTSSDSGRTENEVDSP